MIKTIPATFFNSFGFNRALKIFPKKIARSESRHNASIVPRSTNAALYCVAKSAAATCVLSPHSVRKIIRNADRKMFLSYFFSSFSSFLFRSIYTPKMMKTIPDSGFKIVISTTVVIRFPSTIAIPSTMRNAKKTPKKMYAYCFVLDESNRIETCVLSPSSAIAIARKGMTRSSKMVLTVLLIYRNRRILSLCKNLMV